MDIVILEGLRTPFGKWKGSLSEFEAKEIGTLAVRELLHRLPEAKEADGVLLSQVLQAGQGQNPARSVAVEAGVSLSVPAITLNNVCLGGLASITDAARRIHFNEGELYITGGFDSMTNAPYTVAVRKEQSMGALQLTDTLSNDGLWCALEDESMGVMTDRKNKDFGIDREAQDRYAQMSQERATAASEAGRLQEEFVPLEVAGSFFSSDEGIRSGSSIDKLASLRPVFAEGGTITAGNASQMTDGASVGIISSKKNADALGKMPLARILGWAEVAGPDTSLQTKPAQAIRKVLEKTNLTLNDIDLFEINEAFASVVIASCRDLGIGYDRVNVNGGAIAIGHPLGGTGFRLVLTIAKELQRRGGGKGIASLCGGGGQGMALLIEVPKNW
ncbi:acetyl-CoA C-acyltransferase [Salinicoccus roseus]|uniref:Probable acetyl-CoA acyltransferase n=1 Tax=Salinicoccus roseus TaxID=45670 RepID=A0A0C2E624_9STAP|nr:acetyl-CoA C-acyltransferase [Salinicoccus roseus]KIH70757.1 acetyl-CoA acetyltransferase [Salinicoccus roseus]MDB0580392.1 acetyl-CoA C-acyltransferase [Salinicoccus roseus]